VSGYPKIPSVTPVVAIATLATGKLCRPMISGLFFAETRVTSNCELREFPEVVQPKKEKK
jgi:hypothetical protein